MQALRHPVLDAHEGCTHCAGDPAHIARVAEVARQSFRLASGYPVRVEQLHTTEPGFPPFETRITFWSGNTAQHRYRVFKRAEAVSAKDLPPWWMKDALIVDEHPHCDCCG